MLINNLFPVQEYERGRYLVSTDPAKFDLDIIHNYLSQDSYWAQGVSKDVVQRSLDHSLCYGVYFQAENDEAVQVGFARNITDFATFAYIADVFILPTHQGTGLGKWLIECLLAQPELRDLRKWTLDTGDAHSLYEQFGFQRYPTPEKHMVYWPDRSSNRTIEGD